MKTYKERQEKLYKQSRWYYALFWFAMGGLMFRLFVYLFA